MEASEVTWGGVYKSYFISFVSATVVFMVAFLLSAVVASIFAPVSESNAQTLTVDYANTGYYVSVTSADNVEPSVDATPVGQVAISDTSIINVKTNAPGGYKLYLSAVDNELRASNTSISQTFSPVTSTDLSSNVNSWGFSLSGEDNSWNAVPKVAAGNYTSAGIAYAGATSIGSSSTPNIPDGDNINIYYGINSDTTMPTGTYSTTVTYTAFAEGIYTYPTMQDFTVEQCRNLNAEESITLTDSRDGKEYKVAKLKDGNCWMQQNLALDGGRTLTPADSNVDSIIELPENITEGTVITDTTMQIATQYPGYDGNYYNWCAATVSGDCSNITTTEQTNSVCPKGWQLPSNSGNPSWYSLLNIYGINSVSTISEKIAMVEKDPFYLGSEGYYGGGSGNNEYAFPAPGHTDGNFWTRTPSSSSKLIAYNLGYFDGYFNVSREGGKRFGISARCVMADTDTRTLTNLTYMQDMTTKICANTAEHTSKSLTDKRDNNSYRVTKLKDGNCWMTQNLKLAGPRTLTPSDSNVSANVTIPAAASSGTSVDTTMQIWNEYSGYDGKYYNWCAATVSGNCSAITTEQTNSVCPKGWKLPKNTGYQSFSYLMGKYGLPTSATAGNYVNTVEASPLYFTRNGIYDFSKYSSQGAGAVYWSSSIVDNIEKASGFDYYSSFFGPNYGLYKFYGQSIRCLTN